MGVNPNIAEVASLLGEASRAAILTSLLDRRFHTAGELAYMAAITPQTSRLCACLFGLERTTTSAEKE